VESQDKGVRQGGDKAGHSGMNRQQMPDYIIHAWKQNKEKTLNIVYVHNLERPSSKVSENIIQI